MILIPAGSYACRFNVRDVAFVNLSGSATYRLYCYVHNNTPQTAVSTLKRNAYAAFLDGNVDVEVTNVDEQRDHEALKYLRKDEGLALPAAALVHQSGRSRPIDLPKPDGDDTGAESYDKAVWSAMEGIISSPARKEILKHIVESLGIVLVVEGADAVENREARLAAQRAIERISEMMPLMPKPVDKPPHLIVVPYAERRREAVLLWSLGIDSEGDEPVVTQRAEGEKEPTASGTPGTAEPGKAAAVVIHGRGRRIGPTLTGEGITEGALASTLSVIGADCECGLDRIWMEGDMIPLTWDGEIQARAAKALDFDPENPMIKMEVGQILARGPSFRGERASAFDTSAVGFLGYSEQVIPIGGEPEGANAPPPTQVEQAPSTPNDPAPSPPPPQTAATLVSRRVTPAGIALFVILALGIVGVGVAMLLAAREKAL